jgi:hypothetical protein
VEVHRAVELRVDAVDHRLLRHAPPHEAGILLHFAERKL